MMHRGHEGQRGLRAALSPNEEKTLRQIGAGISMPTFMPAGEVERLKKLQLVEESHGYLIPTDQGRARIAEIARKAA